MANGLFNLKQQLQGLIRGAWSGTSSSNAPKYLEYLVVAGGGGGGRTANGAGGGGGGGLLQGLLPITLGSSYTVTVGSGGAGSTSTGSAGASGVASVLGSISASGGGGGASGSLASTYTNATSGGSGGGGTGGASGAGTTGAQGTAGQGYAGGNGSGNYGGGGGGAGTVGLNSPNTIAGNGGAGIASSISGSVVAYGGGGAGGIDATGSGTGGIGGGGSTGATADSTGVAGTVNTGGGGGGGWASGANQNGGTGGSGIVIVRYSGNTQYFSGGTVTLASGFVIHTFTASGTLAPLTSPVVNGPTNFLSRSLRFRSSVPAYLSRTFGTPTNNLKYTLSFWVKRGTLATQNILFDGGDATGNNNAYLQINASDQLNFSQNLAGNANINLITTQIFRDASAWYHIVLAVDTTQATSTDRVKIYINGVQITSFGTAVYPTLNLANQVNVASRIHNIGKLDYASLYLDAYMTEVNFIDGQQLTPSSFGYLNYYTNVWTPLAYTGTYGSNGSHLTFTDNTALTTSSNVGLGADTSGNGNYWATSGISITSGSTYDSMVDVPTLSGSASNYATWNPLTVNKPNLTNGNLDADGSDLKTAISTIGVSSGKWYWEITIGSGTNTPNMGITSYANDNADPGVYNGVGRSFVSAGGGSGVYKAYTATSTTANSAFSNANTAGATIGFALDCNAGTIAYYVNNTLGYTDSTVATGTLLYPMTCNFNSASNAYRNTSLNTGQRAFAYTPPAGYVALNTYNLPVPAILQGNLYMDATTYTGTGATASITNSAAFKPDLVWIKSRSAATDHKLTDSVRGVTKGLISDTSGAETTDTQGLTAFNANGFSLGTDTNYNNTSATYVAWQWQAGAGTSGSNTNGSVTSTVSANTTSGFSVVTYTGTGANATVGHGLGVTPALLIFKNRTTAATEWPVKTNQLSTNSYLFLNSTGAAATFSSFWPSDPTSSVFSVGTDNRTNGSGNAMVAYCFAQISGFSAFGSYTGNGSATGPFIYTGFQPKYLLVKRTDSTSDWYIWDSVRNTFNIVTNTLLADAAGAETSASSVNILSNGFQCVSSTVVNVSTGTYIYAAFASNPFKYANAF